MAACRCPGKHLLVSFWIVAGSTAPSLLPREARLVLDTLAGLRIMLVEVYPLSM
jgi:hypothetical protein